MAKRKKLSDLESLIKDGENPRYPGGFCAQTANGTAYYKGTGWNDTAPYSWPELPPSPVRPSGRSNRTGE